MNGVDYSKALARERENYQNTIQKDRSNSEKRIASEEERHKELQKKQFENFKEDRNDIDRNYQANLERVKEKTQESIEAQKERFRKMHENDQERFHAERSAQRQDFDSRFRDIKKSYDRSLEGERDMNREMGNTRDERYKGNVTRLTQEKDKRIAEFQERMSGSGSDLKAQNNKEKEALTRTHEQRLKDVYQEEAKKRFTLKDGLQKDLDRTKDAYESEKEQSQEYVKEKVKTLAGKFNTRAETMSSDYAKKNSDFVKKQSEDNFKTNKEHSAEVAEVRRNYEKNLRNIDIDRRRRDNGSGEYAEVVQRQQGKKDEQIFADRMTALRETMVDDRRNYNIRSADESDAYRTTLREENAEAASRLERKERELMADKIVSVANEREKAQRLHNVQTFASKAERDRYEAQINSERNQAGNQVTKLKENFNKSLQDLQTKNESFISQLKDQNDKDKLEFVTKNSQQRNSEILGLRRNFSKLMDTTVNDYEARLSAANRENAQLRDELDQKVSFVMADADRQIKEQAQLYENKREADARAAQTIMDKREANLKNKILEVSNSYMTKMDQQTYNSEMKMKSVISDYEGKLKQLEMNQNKLLAEKQTLHADELKKLKSALEQEKAQIISQYENQITQLKLSQKQQIDQLNDYKRMG